MGIEDYRTGDVTELLNHIEHNLSDNGTMNIARI